MSAEFLIVSPKYKRLLNAGRNGWALGSMNNVCRGDEFVPPEPFGALVGPVRRVTAAAIEGAPVALAELLVCESAARDTTRRLQIIVWAARLRTWFQTVSDDPDVFLVLEGTDVAEGFRAGRRLLPGWTWDTTYDENECPWEPAP